MLRKVLWIAISGGTAAIAAIISRRTAAGIYRTLTGEDPPPKG